jgi:hypothetical protein
MMDDEHAIAEAVLAVLRDPSEITTRSAILIFRSKLGARERWRIADVFIRSMELSDLDELADQFAIAAAQGRQRARERRKAAAA